MGIVGVYIHNLKDSQGRQSIAGKNPFDGFTIKNTPLNQILKVYNPPYLDSKDVYTYIANNIANWTNEAVLIRQKYQ